MRRVVVEGGLGNALNALGCFATSLTLAYGAIRLRIFGALYAAYAFKMSNVRLDPNVSANVSPYGLGHDDISM